METNEGCNIREAMYWDVEQCFSFTTLKSVLAIRKTCGAGGQSSGQWQPTNTHTPAVKRRRVVTLPAWWGKVLGELSDIYVNNRFGDDGVCIDYRIRLMGHNSRQGLPVERQAPKLWTVQPPQIPHTTHKAEEFLCGCLSASDVTTEKQHLKEKEFPPVLVKRQRLLCWVWFNLLLFLGKSLKSACWT